MRLLTAGLALLPLLHVCAKAIPPRGMAVGDYHLASARSVIPRVEMEHRQRRADNNDETHDHKNADDQKADDQNDDEEDEEGDKKDGSLDPKDEDVPVDDTEDKDTNAHKDPKKEDTAAGDTNGDEDTNGVDKDEDPEEDPTVDDTEDGKEPEEDPTVDDTKDNKKPEEDPEEDPTVDDTEDGKEPEEDPTVDDTKDDKKPEEDPEEDPTVHDTKDGEDTTVDDPEDEDNHHVDGNVESEEDVDESGGDEFGDDEFGDDGEDNSDNPSAVASNDKDHDSHNIAAVGVPVPTPQVVKDSDDSDDSDGLDDEAAATSSSVEPKAAATSTKAPASSTSAPAPAPTFSGPFPPSQVALACIDPWKGGEVQQVPHFAMVQRDRFIDQDAKWTEAILAFSFSKNGRSTHVDQYNKDTYAEFTVTTEYKGAADVAFINETLADPKMTFHRGIDDCQPEKSFKAGSTMGIENKGNFKFGSTLTIGDWTIEIVPSGSRATNRTALLYDAGTISNSAAKYEGFHTFTCWNGANVGSSDGDPMGAMEAASKGNGIAATMEGQWSGVHDFPAPDGTEWSFCFHNTIWMGKQVAKNFLAVGGTSDYTCDGKNSAGMC